MVTVGKKSGYQEVRGKLGFFGWIWRILLTLWQVLMIAWFFAYSAELAPMMDAGGAEAVGAAIGGGIGMTMLIVVWACGTVVLGIFVLLTRRTRTIVPIQPTKE